MFPLVSSSSNIWWILAPISSSLFSSTNSNISSLNLFKQWLRIYFIRVIIVSSQKLFSAKCFQNCTSVSAFHILILIINFPFSLPLEEITDTFFSTSLATFTLALLPPFPSDILNFNLLNPTFYTSCFCWCFAKFCLKILFSFLRSESDIIQGFEKSRLALSGCTFKFLLIICIRLSLISNVGFISSPDDKVKKNLPHFTGNTFYRKFSWIFLVTRKVTEFFINHFYIP